MEEIRAHPAHTLGWFKVKLQIPWILLFLPLTEVAWGLMIELMGVLELCLTLMPSRGQTKIEVRMAGWILTEEANFLPPFDVCPPPITAES